MKKIYIATASAAMLLVAASCTETYDILPSEYASVVRIKDGGVKDVTVFSIMDETVYPITIMKGGHDPKSAANVTLHVMDQEEFDAYLLESGAGYSLVPANCYSFEGGEGTSVSVEIPGGEKFEIVNLVMNVSAIGDYLASYTDVARDPVIPIVLEIAEGSVDHESYQMFIIPHYSQPSVGFVGVNEIVLPNGTDVASLRVGMPMDSPWDVTCKVEVDPTVLEEYNAAHNTTYGVMPADAYGAIADVELKEGAEYAPLNIELDTDKAGFLTALPLRITQVDMNGMVFANNTAVVVYEGDYTQYKLDLKPEDASSPDDANDECKNMYGEWGHDGHGPGAIFDGDFSWSTSYFHSCYFDGHHFDETFNSYIEINLHEPKSMVAFDYYPREWYNTGIKVIKIWALDSSDNEWKLIGPEQDVSPLYNYIMNDWDGFTPTIIGSYTASFKFSKVRFSVVQGMGGNGEILAGVKGVNAGYWTCGEMIVYGK